jgi:hypothetical protein
VAIAKMPETVRLMKVRAVLAAGYFALLLAIVAWTYASHRIDALNIGGALGRVDLWIRVRDVGVYSTLALWGLCMAAALGAIWASKIASKLERIYWGALSIVSAPLMTFGLFAVFNAGVHAST